MTAPYVHKAIDQMESIWGGSFKRARAELGVTAFGLGVFDLPPNVDRIPRHVHTFDGQEEVYVPLQGGGTIELGASSVPLDMQTAVRVGPTVSRTVTSGPEGIRVLIAGGTPGEAYRAFAQMERGAPEPDPAELPGIRAAEAHESSDDFTVARFDPADAFSGHRKGVTFHAFGRRLGTSAFGISMVELDGPEAASDYPLHSHAEDDQVEVFIAAEGDGAIVVDGQAIDFKTGEMVAVDPSAQRTLIAGPEGLRFFVIGAPANAPYAGSNPTIG